MIVIVDYNVGNIASLVNMFDHIGVIAEPSGDPNRIRDAARIVLPGVGAFDKAMQSLKERDLLDPLLEAASIRRVPLLGVCLGMQLLARRSEEGELPGLALIEADVVRIPAVGGIKVPHVGWSEIETNDASPLFPSAASGERFYFVHSYYMSCDRAQDVAASIDYGSKLTAAVSADNIHGVQFHPEKSHRFGMRLLKSFAEL